MRTPVRNASFLALMSLSIAPVAAYAQQAASSSEPPAPRATDASPTGSTQAPFDAIAVFTEAVTLLQDGRATDAVVLFRRVAAVRPTPAVFFNLAMAERSLDHGIESAGALRRYLELAGSRIDEARRAEVSALLEAEERSIAYVTIHVRGRYPVTVDGAPVTVDSLEHELAINPGHHVFVVTGDRVRPLQLARDVQPGERFALDLTPERIDTVTRLHLDVNVAEADILVNRLLVATGRYDARARPGRTEVTVRARGYLPFNGSIEVREGTTATLHVRLERDVPITRRTWFWVGAGVLVAGATAAIVIGATSGPEPPAEAHWFSALRAR